MTTRAHFLINEELKKAKAKWLWPSDPIHAGAVLAEEAGELVQACNDFTYNQTRDSKKAMAEEAAQVGAMAIRFLENLDKYQVRESPFLD